MEISYILKSIRDAFARKTKGKSLSPKEKWMLFLLAGLLLAVIVFPIGQGEKKDMGFLSQTDNGRDSKELGKNAGVLELDVQGTLSEEVRTLRQYEASLSEMLESILSEMDGVGKVEAWVTLASGSEKILYQKKDSDVKNLQEQDHEGGTRKETTEKIQQEVLLDNSGNPYIIKTLQPEVEGVLVLAEGAGNGTVKKNITEAVEVLFGIEAHRIKVAKKKVEE